MLDRIVFRKGHEQDESRVTQIEGSFWCFRLFVLVESLFSRQGSIELRGDQ